MKNKKTALALLLSIGFAYNGVNAEEAIENVQKECPSEYYSKIEEAISQKNIQALITLKEQLAESNCTDKESANQRINEAIKTLQEIEQATN